MFSRGVTVSLGIGYVLCTLLQIAGFATPAWVVSEYNGEIYESNGLWYSVSCRSGMGCETKTYQQIYEEYNTANKEMVFVDQLLDVVIAALSVVAAIAGSILLLVNICTKHQRPVLSLIAILLTFVSASLIWTIIASALVPVLTEDTKTYRLPYSVLLSALGSTFSVVLALVYLVRLIKVMSALSPSYQPLK